MLKLFSRTAAIAACIALTAALLPCTASADTQPLDDSGLDYSEYVGTVNNPAAGYTNTIWAVCKPDSTPVYSPTAKLVLFFIDIGAFSSGMNGTKNSDGTYTAGEDIPLDETFFDSWRQTFENCRKNGCTVAVRFRYDANGSDNPEPASFDALLSHIDQLTEHDFFGQAGGLRRQMGRTARRQLHLPRVQGEAAAKAARSRSRPCPRDCENAEYLR